MKRAKNARMAKTAVRNPSRISRTAEGEKHAAMPEISQTGNQRNHGGFGPLANPEVFQ